MGSLLSFERVAQIAISVLLVMVSASIHEFGHAYTAYRLGDDTAKRAGRLTINPLAHIDRFGSVILPLIMGVMGGPIFAFAKPVPYNPRNLRNPRRDEVIVGFAGPLMNVLQATVGAVAARVLWEVGYTSIVMGGVTYWLYIVFTTYVYVNCTLAFFNLIPLPPLDGSSIIAPLLKGEALRKDYVVQRYSLPILMVVMYLLPGYLHFDPLGIYLDATAGNLVSLLLGW